MWGTLPTVVETTLIFIETKFLVAYVKMFCVIIHPSTPYNLFLNIVFAFCPKNCLMTYPQF